jgi:uncharacterized membrane protein required for colicin V production
MNYIDIIVLGAWGLAALWGFLKGLVQMVVPLVVVVAGLALSTRLAEPVGNLFARFTQSENLQTILGYGAIVFGLIVVAMVLSMVVKFMLKFIPLAGLADKLGGALVGIMVGFVLVSGALVALQKFPVGEIKADIDQSVVGNAIADRFSLVISAFGLIPDDWRSRAEDLKDKAQEAVPPLVPGAPK